MDGIAGSLLTVLVAAAWVGAAVMMLRRNRRWRAHIVTLEQRVETLSDQSWELRDAEERAKSLLEAQGDVIVRRDSDGRITYANDAFCGLASAPRDTLIGRSLVLRVLSNGEVSTLADG